MGMEEFCGTPFWDASLLNQSLPDTSPCFQETLMSWLPAAYLWILAPLYNFYLKKNNGGFIKVSTLHRVKSFIGLLLILPPLLDVFKGIADLVQTNGGLPLVYVVTPAIITLTMILAFALVQLERLRGVRSSAVLFIFWAAAMVCSLFEFWSKCLNASQEGGEDLFRYITFFVFFVLLVLAMILSSFVDDKPFYSPVADDQNICPEEHASFISKLTYWWFTSLITLGYKRPLTTSDLWLLQVRDKASTVVQEFRKNWKAEKRKAFAAYHKQQTRSPESGDNHPNVLMVTLEQDADGEVHTKHDIYKGEGEDPETSSIGEVILEKATHVEKKVSLLKALTRTYGPAYLVGTFLKLINDVMVFVQPLILRLLIQFIETPSVPTWWGVLYAIILLVVAITSALINNWADYIISLIAMHVRTSILGSVYRKAMHLSSSARKSSTIGEVVNLMSVDAQRLMDLCMNLHVLWSSPMQIIITLFLLVQILGAAVFAGVFVLIMLVPVNMWVAGRIRVLQIKQMTYKDARVKMMGEVLSGIKVLKLYAWERSFEEKVMQLRREELKVLRKAAYYNVISFFGWSCAPFVVTLVSFAVYLLSNENNVLDAETIFVSLSLFNLLRFPLGLLPMVIINVVQANVSIKRLSGFMKQEELDPQNVDHFNMPGQAITVDGGKFSWDQEEEPILKDINLDIRQGSLVAIVGQVGAGKSSLLSALLGEMEKRDGKVFVQGSVGYIAQQAWIQNDTVRGNVLFGKDINNSKYEKVLQACALARDLEVLPGGDLTEIGEKGINLSGGQKQRVSIARAVYNNSDIYLLDDPLSAVDAHVGKHIFENVIGPNGLLKKKTRVLVTHSITFLPQVDNIVVLKDGQISEVGSYNELLEKNGAFAEFLQNYSLREDDDVDEKEEGESMSIFSAKSKSIAESFRGSVLALATNEDAEVKLGEERTELIEEEKVETGKVSGGVYLTYVKAVGPVLCIAIVSFYLLFDVFSVGSAIWLSKWSQEPTVNGTHPLPVRNKYLMVYGLFGLGQALATIFSEVFFAQGVVRSARRTHTGLLTAVFRAPMRFFDVTPLGRILNRFSRDIAGVDQRIPLNFSVVLRVLIGLVEVFLAIIYGIPITAVIIVPIGVMYVFIQRYYVCTTRQLKRLESISRSPIYSHFSESLSGTSTIRAFGKQKEFILQNESLIDRNQETHYPNIVSQRWLIVRLSFIGNTIVFFATLFSTLGRETISSGIVGLVVVYAMQVTGSLQWMVKMTSELETNIVAVERIKEYTEIDQEAPMDIPEKKPEDSWPTEGKVEIQEYSTRYREGLDLVLKGISVTIKPGEKVGIVGRTGAGKSSLTLGLFRIIESAGGSISIDGVDIATIGLYDLRSKVTIIPQDPVLFAGDLRMNLDPFEKYTDDQIWEALRHSHLDQFVTGLEAGLMHQCTEGGTNLSVGQRQLICLARALLRKTKILVLDEATAAVDLETDDLIQATIRTEFDDCTVITIAHRLNTIMDNTRVLVLEAGEVSEYDSPTNLLEKGGVFYGMAKEAGLVTS